MKRGAPLSPARPTPYRPALRGALLGALFGCVLTGPLSAQRPDGSSGRSRGTVRPIDPLSVPRPSVQAARVDEPVVVDGHLADAAWLRARPAKDTWLQTNPDLGMPASEPTTVRLVYDDEALYVGVVLYDSETDRLSVPGLEQDFDTPSADIFGIAIDTYHDEQNGFLFAVNPGGALWDAQAFNDQRDLAPAWEGIVDVETSVNDSSWIVEMKIPFTTLRFNPTAGEQTWGINFSRRIRKRNEDAIWAPLPVQYRVYKFSLAGDLEGLRDLPAGRNLWVKPYALGERLSGARHGAVDADGDLGLDAKWGLTSRLTLDLTANTDFSQVEVDREQVNLSRFSLFFPERRDFFLENEGTFAFQDISIRNYRTGSGPNSFRLFNSRRIGLSSSREPLPIGGGARLTGRIGDRLEVGFLDMQTRTTNELLDEGEFTAENFAVARVKAHLGGGSTVGAMFINRQETAGSGPSDYNRSFGIDANVEVARNVLVSAYWARTEDRTPVGPDNDVAMGQVAWRNTFWNVSGLFKHVGDGFAPETGFIDRTGVRRYYGTLGVHPRVLGYGVREVNPYIEIDTYTDLSDRLETRTLRAGAEVSLLSGGSITLTVADRFERLFEPTPIGQATVPTGTYEWIEPALRLSTAGNRRLSVSASAQTGDFFDGTRTSISGDVTYRVNEHLLFEVGTERNDLELGGESFTADLFTARARYAYDTRTFLTAFAQYNESDDELILNARFNLIHAPLSDVFLVYTERRSFTDDGGEALLERGLTLKATKLLAF